MDYFDKTCGGCAHLERAADVAIARLVTRCRQSLHLLGGPTPRGVVAVAVYAEVAPEFAACSHFTPRHEGDGEPAPATVVDGGLGALLARRSAIVA